MKFYADTSLIFCDGREIGIFWHRNTKETRRHAEFMAKVAAQALNNRLCVNKVFEDGEGI